MARIRCPECHALLDVTLPAPRASKASKKRASKAPKKRASKAPKKRASKAPKKRASKAAKAPKPRAPKPPRQASVPRSRRAAPPPPSPIGAEPLPAARAAKRQSRSAAKKPSADEFVAALAELARKEPRQALFSARELRAELPAWSKQAFDEAALALSRAGKVTLHHHDHPHGMSAADREMLIHDAARNVYYVGIAPKKSEAILPDEVIETAKRLAHGKTRTRVMLRDLRAAMPDVPRDLLDAALKLLQVHGRIVLYREDNNAALKPADEEAALYMAGSPRHLLYVE